MFRCLVRSLSLGDCDEGTRLPLSALKVNTGMWGEEAMSCTSSCTNTSSFQLRFRNSGIENGSVIVTGQFLHQASIRVSDVDRYISSHLLKLLCRFQVSLVGCLRDHECVSVCQWYVVFGIAHVMMLGAKVSIQHDGTHVLPSTEMSDFGTSIGFGTYVSGSAFQSSGRLTPGCGHAGHRTARAPGCTPCKRWPKPEDRRSRRLRHCRDVRSSSL